MPAMFAADFGSELIRVIWRDRGLRANLRTGYDKTMNLAWAISESMAPEVENYAKLNAPWTDQTGNARNGLAARAYKEGDAVGIILYHQVVYGIWLEVRWSGRYAIINPTIEVMGPKVMARYNRLLEKIR